MTHIVLECLEKCEKELEITKNSGVPGYIMKVWVFYHKGSTEKTLIGCFSTN